MNARESGRRSDQLRAISFEPDFLENPHGSVVITQGKTKVLCTAMVDEDVPRWMRNQGRGWITAEYSLLPASTAGAGHAAAASSSAIATRSTSPSGSCRKRSPTARKRSGSPVVRNR